VPKRLGSLVTLATSSRCGGACDFSLHEQALITRSVLSLFPKTEILSLLCRSSIY
jgi:hypothetical protein